MTISANPPRMDLGKMRRARVLARMATLTNVVNSKSDMTAEEIEEIRQHALRLARACNVKLIRM